METTRLFFSRVSKLLTRAWQSTALYRLMGRMDRKKEFDLMTKLSAQNSTFLGKDYFNQDEKTLIDIVNFALKAPDVEAQKSENEIKPRVERHQITLNIPWEDT